MVYRSSPDALDPAGFACNYPQRFANRPVCGHGHRNDIAYGYESVKTDAMRRALVLTDESRRHWFRASLPPHVVHRANEIERQVPWRLRLGLTRSDLESVAATYVAGFVGTMTFIL